MRALLLAPLLLGCGSKPDPKAPANDAPPEGPPNATRQIYGVDVEYPVLFEDGRTWVYEVTIDEQPPRQETCTVKATGKFVAEDEPAVWSRIECTAEVQDVHGWWAWTAAGVLPITEAMIEDFDPTMLEDPKTWDWATTWCMSDEGRAQAAYDESEYIDYGYDLCFGPDGISSGRHGPPSNKDDTMTYRLIETRAP